MPVPTPPKNGNNGFNWARFSKTLSFWILIILIPVALIQMTGARAESASEIRYDFYRQQLESGNIAEVTVQGGKNVVGSFKEPRTIQNKTTKKFTIQLPAANSPEEVKLLMDKGVQITSQDPKPSVMAWVINFLPWLLLIGFYLFLFRQMQAGGNKAFSYG
jgi:cell division protease FtsH